MFGRLTAVVRALRAGRRRPAVPFEIVCLCGRPVRGTRRPCAQHVLCPDCGRWVFVLPLDVYPPPDAVPASHPRNTPTGLFAALRRLIQPHRAPR